jgi:hypothetical protein
LRNMGARSCAQIVRMYALSIPSDIALAEP